MNLGLVIGAIIWIGLGELDAAYSYKYLQTKYSSVAKELERYDFWFGQGMGIVAGPVALAVSYVMGWTKYGMQFRRNR